MSNYTAVLVEVTADHIRRCERNRNIVDPVEHALVRLREFRDKEITVHEDGEIEIDGIGAELCPEDAIAVASFLSAWWAYATVEPFSFLVRLPEPPKDRQPRLF